MFVTGPPLDRSTLLALALLSALAIIAELLGFFLSSSAKGSIAFIPYLAAVLIVPSWATVVSAVAVKLAAELLRGAQPIKVVFNVSQHAVATAFAIAVYLGLGGTSLLEQLDLGLAAVTVTSGLPALGALAASFIANGILVTGVIAINTNRQFHDVIRETFLPSLGLDLLATPVVFIFAWVYARYGPIAASALWVPILGLRQLNKTNAELDRMNQELLQLMVKSIEARDPYTSGHSRRVERFARQIARAIGLSSATVNRVSQAALLHDVGKINEKYAPILLKPDKLTPAEWEIMQQHPADGAELVSTMSQLHDLVPSIRHHHERWDGRGYPDGLAGEQIPLASRIIALADTVDAMTSERPYRPPLTYEQVKHELIRGRGTQFDPEIVDRLILNGLWLTIFAPPRDTGGSFSGPQLVGPASHGVG